MGQILKLIIPWTKDYMKSIPPHAIGIEVYLDSARLMGIREISDLSNYPHKQVDDYTFEIYGEFEIKDGVIYGK